MHDKNTDLIGKVLLSFPSLPSTNAYAIDLITKSRPEEGTAVQTDYQTAGRGQIGSSWWSAPGENLTISVILYPRFLPVPHHFFLNVAASLAVRDSIRFFLDQQPVHIKWPNDILVQDRKVAGILIQNGLQGPSIQWSVVGIGINANAARFPHHLPQAGSLLTVGGRPVDLPVLRQTLFRELEHRYRQLQEGRLAILKADYLQHLHRLREPARYQVAGGEPFVGAIIGIDEDGRLLIEAQGLTSSYDIKQIVYL